MTTPPDDRFYLELTRLLLNVASSDDELHDQEVQSLLGASRRWGVPTEEAERLVGLLREGKPLPAPNLGLLRQNPDKVLAEVHALIHSDDVAHFSEHEMLAQIRELLGLPPEP